MTDDFNRANGALGADWSNTADPGLLISSNKAIGTAASGFPSDSYFVGTFSNDQFSEITITGDALSSGQGVGAAVRMKPDGSMYSAFYRNDIGVLHIGITHRNATGAFIDFATPTVISSPYPAGTKLRLVIVGAILSMQIDGEQVLSFCDDSQFDPGNIHVTSGNPGIQMSGAATCDDWSGGDASFEAYYLSTDGNNVETWSMISRGNGYSVHTMRVLRPDSPAVGKDHNFLYVLHVREQGDTTYGDGLEQVRLGNLHNLYNLTVIQPGFQYSPWFADNPVAGRASLQYETFMTDELRPWVDTNLSISGIEKNWLIGFSKSAMTGIGFLLRNPSFFDVAGIWDCVWETIPHYDSAGEDMAVNYGNDLNYQNNYRLTDTFFDTWRTPFLTQNRIHLSGYKQFEVETDNMDAKLTAKGVLHTYEKLLRTAHRWDSGWVPATVAGLDILSQGLPEETLGGTISLVINGVPVP